MTSWLANGADYGIYCERFVKMIADGHDDSSVKTIDQDGNDGDVLGVFVNDLDIVEIEIA